MSCLKDEVKRLTALKKIVNEDEKVKIQAMIQMVEYNIKKENKCGI